MNEPIPKRDRQEDDVINLAVGQFESLGDCQTTHPVMLVSSSGQSCPKANKFRLFVPCLSGCCPQPSQVQSAGPYIAQPADSGITSVPTGRRWTLTRRQTPVEGGSLPPQTFRLRASCDARLSPSLSHTAAVSRVWATSG